MSSSVTSQLRLARVRALKASRLAVRPAMWKTVRQGVVPSLEHSDVAFSDATATVLDVGASRGQFASFASHRFPRARIISFEPLPESRAILEAVTGGRSEVVPVAIGLEEGTASLHVAGHDDASSLLPIGERQIAEFPGTAEARAIEVEVAPLSRYITDDLSRPTLLKIDVQGLELDVLRGAGERLDLIDEIFVECSFTELYEGQALADEVIAFLLARGHRLVGVYGTSQSAGGGSLQADLLFRRTA